MTSLVNLVNPLSYRRRPQSSRTLIRNFSGAINAGEMLLVLGKPGSGCTTFLKTLANMQDEYKDTKGKITYGRLSAQEVAERYPADIAFCGMSRALAFTSRPVTDVAIQLRTTIISPLLPSKRPCSISSLLFVYFVGLHIAGLLSELGGVREHRGQK